jgi:hypothetical protein
VLKSLQSTRDTVFLTAATPAEACDRALARVRATSPPQHKTPLDLVHHPFRAPDRAADHELQLGDIPTCTANGSMCRGLAYLKRVAPTLPRSPSPFYYSWNHGLVHFVSISFESGWEAGGAQAAWLREDLGAVDRSQTPWVVLYVHRPFYCSNTYSCNLTAPFVAVYEPLMYSADGSVAVAFYNPTPATANIAVAFADLGQPGWGAATAAKVRDLWAHADLPAATGRYPAAGAVAVDSHATHVVRLTKA